LRPFFGGKSWRNLPFSAKRRQRKWQKKRFCATGFIKTCQVVRLVSSCDGPAVRGRRLAVGGQCGKAEARRTDGCQSVDSTMVVGQFTEENRRRLAHSKGLVTVLPAQRPGDLFGFCGASETWRRQPIDSGLFVGRFTEENRRTSAPSKGLANCASSRP